MERITKGGVDFAIANDREGFNETRDCPVRAIKNATGVPYRDAHAFCAQHGRRQGKGMYFSNLLDKLVTDKAIVFGYRIARVDCRSKVTRMRYDMTGFHRRPVELDGPAPTLLRAIRLCREGRYIAIKSGHTFAIIDGVVHDMGAVGTHCRVNQLYKLEPSSIVGAREQAREDAALLERGK